jgi:hypothetical protein
MSYVYAVQAGSFIKFGKANDPRARLAHMQIGCPLTITFIGRIRGGRRLETALHDYFHEYRKHGEWFHLSKRMERVLQSFAKNDRETVCEIIGYVPSGAESCAQKLNNHIKLEKQPKTTQEEADAFCRDISLEQMPRLYRRS